MDASISTDLREQVNAPALEAITHGYSNAMLQALTNWTVLELPMTRIGAEAQWLFDVYLSERFPRQMRRHWETYNAVCPNTLRFDAARQQQWNTTLRERAAARAAQRLADYHFDEVFLDLPNQPAQHEELFRTLQRDRLLDGLIELLNEDRQRLARQLRSDLDEVWQASEP